MYRRAHIWFFVAFVVVLGGFGPTFFTRLGETPWSYLIHGGSATLWFIMLISQSWLITHGQPGWHRKLGWASLAVFPAMLLSGLHMVRLMLTVRLEGYGDLAYTLALIDIPSVVLLGVFYALALKHRREVQLHSRYMSATVILLLPPALGRFMAFWVPGIDGLVPALNPMMVVTEAIAVALIIHDWRGGKVYPPYPITLGALVVIHALMWPAPRMEWWVAFSLWFGGG
ncbi:MAG: hypothetical protein WEA09_02560 [Gemmatimonadota bacterium]